MNTAEFQYVLQNRLLHCFWFYRKSCQICQSKVNQLGTYVGTRFCSPVKSLSNSMTHHTCPKKGKTNPSTFHPSQFCHNANKYFTTVYTVHVDKKAKKGEKVTKEDVLKWNVIPSKVVKPVVETDISRAANSFAKDSTNIKYRYA